MELHQIKKLCTAKETINRMKSQATIWEKIFPNNISDKGQYSNTKNFHNLTFNKNPKPDFKMAENLNRYFFKQGIQTADKVHEKMLNSTNHQGNAN